MNIRIVMTMLALATVLFLGAGSATAKTIGATSGMNACTGRFTCCEALIQVNCTPCDSQCNRWCDVWFNGFCCDITRDQCKIIAVEEVAAEVNTVAVKAAPTSAVPTGALLH